MSAQERPGAEPGVTLTAREATALRALLLATTQPGYASTGQWEDAVAGAARYAPGLDAADYDAAAARLLLPAGRRRARPGNPGPDRDPHWWACGAAGSAPAMPPRRAA